MRIANPIYDSVFKYLLEDMDIAKELLALILDEEIIELDLQPQESTYERFVSGQSITVYRLDFKALIRNKDDSTKKVLIELQKNKRFANIKRFRQYLAANYRKEDSIVVEGKEIKLVLPIITIYLLGFTLPTIPVAVLKANSCYTDVVKGERFEQNIQEPFITLLNHESYTIQIPLLTENDQNRLENVLNIFSQRYVSKDDVFELDVNDKTEDPLLKKIIYRLNKGILSEQMMRNLELEEQMEENFEQELGPLYEEIAQKSKIIEESKKVIEDKDKTIEDKDKAIEDKDKTIETQLKELEELRKRLNP
jgi:hypothetical protein